MCPTCDTRHGQPVQHRTAAAHLGKAERSGNQGCRCIPAGHPKATEAHSRSALPDKVLDHLRDRTMRATGWELIINGNDTVENLLKPADTEDRCVALAAKPEHCRPADGTRDVCIAILVQKAHRVSGNMLLWVARMAHVSLHAEQAAHDEGMRHRQTIAASSGHLLVSFLSSGRSKGYWPKSMTYSITPLLQMSAFTPS